MFYLKKCVNVWKLLRRSTYARWRRWSCFEREIFVDHFYECFSCWSPPSPQCDGGTTANCVFHFCYETLLELLIPFTNVWQRSKVKNNCFLWHQKSYSNARVKDHFVFLSFPLKVKFEFYNESVYCVGSWTVELPNLSITIWACARAIIVGWISIILYVASRAPK